MSGCIILEMPTSPQPISVEHINVVDSLGSVEPVDLFVDFGLWSTENKLAFKECRFCVIWSSS